MSWTKEINYPKDYSSFIGQAQALVVDLKEYERQCMELTSQISTQKEEATALQSRNVQLQASESEARDQLATITQKFQEATALTETLSQRNMQLSNQIAKLKEEATALQSRNVQLQSSEVAARDQLATITQKFQEATALAETLSQRNAELERNNQKMQEQLSAGQKKWSTLKELVLEKDNDELVEKEKATPTKKRTERVVEENVVAPSTPPGEKRSRPLTPEEELKEKLKQLVSKPNSAKLNAEVGHLYHKLKNPKKALEYLRKGFELGNQDWINQYYIGFCYYNLGDLLKADHFLTESIKLNEKDACTYTIRCKVNIKKGDKQAAQADLTQAEKLGEKLHVVNELKLRIASLK